MAASENTTATNYVRFVDCCTGDSIRFNGAIGLTDGNVYSYTGLTELTGFGGKLYPGRCYTVNLEYTSTTPIPYPPAPSLVLFSGKSGCLDPKCGECSQLVCDCPPGYTEKDGECSKVQYVNAEYSGGLLNLQAGAKNCGYGCGGALLYEDITLLPKPILGSGTFYGNYKVQDASANDVAVWDPATTSTYNTWNFTNPGIYNTLWGSSQGSGTSCSSSHIPTLPCSTGSANGRLNTVGIWAAGIGINTELAFEFCIDVTETKQYLIGLAGDNYVRFYVDGTLYVDLTDSTGGARIPFNFWHIFPVTLSAGNHTIKLVGLDLGGVASFGGEIYNISESIFRATLGVRATGPSACGNQLSDINPYLLFSTKNYVGSSVANPLQPGEWSCPEGSSGELDFCNGVPQCKITDAFKIVCDCYMLIPCDGSDPVLTNNPDFEDYINQFATVSSVSYTGCAYVTKLLDNDCTNLESANVNAELPCNCVLNCYYVQGTNGFLYVDENNQLQEISKIENTPYSKICSKVYPVPENSSQNYTIINLGPCDENGCPIICYKLTNCDDPTDIIYTNSDTIVPYVFGTNNVVRILNRNGCYIASVLDEGEICDCPISVTVTASFSTCIACTGYKAYKLTSCETGDVIYTTDDLELYINKTIQTDCGCYLVKQINYLPPSPQSVIVEYVFDNCEKCLATYYKLSNCSTDEVVAYTLTDLSALVGKFVKIEGCDECLIVEETREPGITLSVQVTETFLTCQACVLAGKKCKCQSAVSNAEVTVALRYIDCNGNNASTSQIPSGKRSDKYCVLEWVTGDDIIDYGDCTKIDATCVLYVINVPAFPDQPGGILHYKDCDGQDVQQSFPKGKVGVTIIKCGIPGQTSNDIYTVGTTLGTLTWTETETGCGDTFNCPDPVYPKRPVIPGYTTPGCDIEKFEKITCNASEILYKTVLQKRYGISNCCPDEDDKWLIKKELVDLQGLVDPNYNCEPVQTCCTGSSNCNCGCNNTVKTCNS